MLASLGPRACRLLFLTLLLPLCHRSIRQQNVGLHGGGQAAWWALRVRFNRERQVCEALERQAAEFLPPLEPAEPGGPPRPRVVETWAPKKTLKVWSPK